MRCGCLSSPPVVIAPSRVSVSRVAISCFFSPVRGAFRYPARLAMFACFVVLAGCGAYFPWL